MIENREHNSILIVLEYKRDSHGCEEFMLIGRASITPAALAASPRTVVAGG